VTPVRQILRGRLSTKERFLTKPCHFFLVHAGIALAKLSSDGRLTSKFVRDLCSSKAITNKLREDSFHAQTIILNDRDRLRGIV
jgi:hypothetical protein